MKRALTFIIAMAVASQLANWTVFAAAHQYGKDKEAQGSTTLSKKDVKFHQRCR